MSTNNTINKIVITGGAGYIGSTLINEIPDDCHIIVIDNFHIDTPQKRKNNDFLQKAKKVTYIDANVSETEKYAKEIEGADAIVYMASLNSYKDSNADPLLYLRENAFNVQVFLNTVREKAPHVKKMIVTSSRGVYGEGPYLCQDCSRRQYPSLSERIYCSSCGSSKVTAQFVHEDDQTNPSSYYGLSKKFQEDIIRLYCTQQNIHLDILRIFNVFGEDQGEYYSNIGIVPQIFNQIRQEKAMYLQGNGLLTRDFVYVKDVVNIIRSSLFMKEKRRNVIEVYNIGSGIGTSIEDIAGFFEKIGYSFTKEYIDSYNDIKYSVADNTKVLEDYNIPPFTTLSDFLKKTYTGSMTA